jgi:hypothetical protein
VVIKETLEAVSFLEIADPDGDAQGRARLREIRPPNIEASWRLLGYDGADEYLESAVSMLAAAREGEENVLRLNNLSLFDERATAEGFRDLVTRLRPEQSPYCVYGIWEVH